MRARRDRGFTAVSIMIFAATGAASRAHWQMFETRWQIMAFVVAATVIEGVRKLIGDRPSAWRWAAMSVAAMIAITTVKFVLEPRALQHDVATVKSAVSRTRSDGFR